VKPFASFFNLASDIESRTRIHIWVEFVVVVVVVVLLLLFCSFLFRSFFSGISLFIKINISKFQFDMKTAHEKLLYGYSAAN